MNLRSPFILVGLVLIFGNVWAESGSTPPPRKPSAAFLSKEDIARLPTVRSGLICVDDTTPSRATAGLNTSLNVQFDGSYIVILEETPQKLARVAGGKVVSHTITSYPSQDSAMQVRFLACALVSGK